MQPRHILIADDDRLVRESLADALDGYGRVRAAESGRAAIAELCRDRCDLLVSDIDMPDLTGFELLDWVRDHRTRAPNLTTSVVLMSARADAALETSARAGGAMALLAKPVEIPRLTRLVHQLFAPTSRLSPT